MSYFAYIITFSHSIKTGNSICSSSIRCGYIAIDQGYPYETSNRFSAKMFTSVDDAIAIINKISNRNTTYRIVGLKEELILNDEIEKKVKDNVIKRAKATFSEEELKILLAELKEKKNVPT